MKNMFSISINEMFELTGYSVHITKFSKGPTYMHLEMISKVLIILFLLCLWV